MSTSIDPHQAKFQALVRISCRYSCGCTQSKGELVPNIDANLMPGSVVICEAHQEYAVVTRVSSYLEVNKDVFKRLLEANGIDPDTAEYVAVDQTPDVEGG